MITRGRRSAIGAVLVSTGMIASTLVAVVVAGGQALAAEPIAVSNNSRQTVQVPVAPGLQPTRISGTVTEPTTLNGGRLVNGRVVVTAGGERIYRGPARAAAFKAKLKAPKIVDGALAVSIRYLVKGLRANACASNLQQVSLSVDSVAFAGQQTQPTTVGEFLQPGISGVNVVIPDSPTQDQIEAGLAAVGAVSYRLGSSVQARLSQGALDPQVTQLPGARVIQISDAQGSVSTTLGMVSGLPQLTVSGHGPELGAATAALGGDKMVLADGSKVTGLTQTIRPTVNLNQPFSQLGQPQPQFKGWGSQVIDLNVSQSQFGSSVSDVRVRLVGSTTQIPEGAKASLNVYWNQSLVGSVDLAESPAIDNEISVPNSMVAPGNQVRVELATTPKDGVCTGSEVTTPIGVSLDGELSQVRASRGQTLSPGFERFPQSLGGSLPVSFAQGDPGASAIQSAALMVAALQRENVPQLAISVLPYSQVESGPESTLVVDANEAVSTKLGAPLTLNQLREVTSSDLDFKVNVKVPYSALEAFPSGTRNMLLLGGWAPDGESGAVVQATSLELAEYVYARPGGWSSLLGDIAITEQNGEPQILNSNAVVPQPAVTQVDRSAFWWMIAVIVIFVGLGAWRYLHVRRRRSGEIG